MRSCHSISVAVTIFLAEILDSQCLINFYSLLLLLLLFSWQKPSKVSALLTFGK